MPAIRTTAPLSTPDHVDHDKLQPPLDLLDPARIPDSPVSVDSPLSSAHSEVANDEPFVPTSSHARKRKKGHIPRPPNAFMMFRSEMWRSGRLTSSIRDHRSVSTIAGMLWRELIPEERRRYQVMAEQAKQQHMIDHPGYKYSPTTRKQQKSPKKRVRNDDLNKEECWKVAVLMRQGYEGHQLENALKNGLGDIDILPALPPPVKFSPSRARRRGSRSQNASFDLNATLARPVTPTRGYSGNINASLSPEYAFNSQGQLPECQQTPNGVDMSLIERGLSAIKIYPTQTLGGSPEVLPPRIMPTWLDSHTGVKPQILEFTQNYHQDLDDGFSSPTTNASIMTGTPIDYLSNSIFTTAFSADGLTFAEGTLNNQFINMPTAAIMGEESSFLFEQMPGAYSFNNTNNLLESDPVFEEDFGFWLK